MTANEMQDKFTQFFNQFNNQSVEREDSSALDQCMDLAFAWCDTLGVGRAAIRHPYAYMIWSQPNDTTRKYFDLFPNTPSFIPQTGDIAVFGITNGIPVGHVSIVALGSTLMNLVSFDENWDTLNYYHTVNGLRVPYSRQVVHYNYYGVVGFLRFKQPIQPPTPHISDAEFRQKVRDIVLAQPSDPTKEKIKALGL